MKFKVKPWGQIKAERRHAKIERLSKWHRKFAWWPIRTEGDNMIWMERILRKGRVHYRSGGTIRWDWSYKENIFDLLKMEPNS